MLIWLIVACNRLIFAFRSVNTDRSQDDRIFYSNFPEVYNSEYLTKNFKRNIHEKFFVRFFFIYRHFMSLYFIKWILLYVHVTTRIQMKICSNIIFNIQYVFWTRTFFGSHLYTLFCACFYVSYFTLTVWCYLSYILYIIRLSFI